ncbi:c-type cytochrome biogenesis protein CcmI [Paraglaciecola aquimarina]|uniref:C-type cytochrome biogenesis protein CcmI n=1 Tax=Paraglaciecola algarum TaxID=3050085 RepID=A0ABS9D6R6_9ALTE|nr:c-type cytochrome biogenesis protein CcmI [Paraglaciecola sp. G1-23]
MNEFYIGAGLLVAFGILIAVFPWLRSQQKSQSEQTHNLTNTSLIRQRMMELNEEQQQGLLTQSDKQQAENELKLALLDEVKDKEQHQTGGQLVLALGLLCALIVGGATYYYASQLNKVEHWLVVQGKTSELGQRILQGDENLTLEDMQDFALGLRSRLLEKPEDPIGWMLLGRVSGALNRIDTSIEAFERSVKYDTNNIGTLTSYAQALLMTGEEQNMLHSRKILQHILSLEKDNTSAMGMLAVVAAELGDKALALENWKKLREYVDREDPNYLAINQRIEQLSIELQSTASGRDNLVADVNETSTNQQKQLEVTVDISDELKAKLPSSGFLFVFAQAASGSNRMPAAVVKMPLGDFPLVIELSDKNAMMGSYTLSQLNSAKLVARVSVDGNVAQAAGELQGDKIVNLSASELNRESILISREL